MIGTDFIIIRRHPYEEPYHTQLEIIASNVYFLGSTDIYINVDELKIIGEKLEAFPSKIGDECVWEYGSENPSEKFYRHFILRAYTINSLGHCAIQITINQNMSQPDEGVCTFSIKANAASINRLGKSLKILGELNHLELSWSLSECEIHKEHSYTFPQTLR